MRMMRTQSGPFVERPYYEDSEIETIATDELRQVDLYPAAPEPIRVERFIEKRFDIVPRYEDLPADVLGYTKFGLSGVEKIVVSRSLSEEGSRVAERRMSATLAHEAGHVLLHGHLFALQRRPRSRPLFKDGIDESRRTILCRTGADGIPPAGTSTTGYDGRWWEFQANKIIGALLLPCGLVNAALGPPLASQGRLGVKTYRCYKARGGRSAPC